MENITIKFDDEITNAEKIEIIFKAFGLEKINIHVDMVDVFAEYVDCGWGFDSETVKWLAELLSGKVVEYTVDYNEIVRELNNDSHFLKNGDYKIIRMVSKCFLAIFDDYNIEPVGDTVAL